MLFVKAASHIQKAKAVQLFGQPTEYFEKKGILWWVLVRSSRSRRTLDRWEEGSLKNDRS
jgi:hypothetical protein